MRKRYKHLLNNKRIKKIWLAGAGLGATLAIIFALTVPLSHQLISKNGVVDYADDLLEQAAETIALVTGRTATASPPIDLATVDEAQTALLQPIVPPSAEPQASPDLDPENELVSLTTPMPLAANAAVTETRDITLQLITAGGNYPVSGELLYIVGTDFHSDVLITDINGMVEIADIPTGEIFWADQIDNMTSGYAYGGFFEFYVPTLQENPNPIVIQQSIALNPFEIIVKTVDENNQPLANAVFELTQVSTQMGAKGTDASGQAVFGNIPSAGVYQLRQTAAPVDHQGLAGELVLAIGQNSSGMAVEVTHNGTSYAGDYVWALKGNAYALTITVKNHQGEPEPEPEPEPDPTASLRIRKIEKAGSPELDATGELMEALEQETGLDGIWFAVLSLWDKNLTPAEYTSLLTYQGAYDFYQNNQNTARIVQTATLGTAPNQVSGLIELADLPVNTENLSDSRYLILELNDENHPLPGEIVAAADPMIVNLPTPSTDGHEHLFDVKIYPKNERVLANVELLKVDDQGAGLSGAVFDLYKWVGGTEVRQPDSYTTDSNGQILIQDLGVGQYYLKETKAPANYQLDQKEIPFAIDRETHGQTIQLSAVNYPKIFPPEKYASKSSYDFGEVVTWYVYQRIPANIKELSRFEMVDYLDSKLSFIEDSVTIPALNAGDYTVSHERKDGAGILTISLTESGKNRLHGLAVELSISFQTKLTTPEVLHVTNQIHTITESDDLISPPDEVRSGQRFFQKVNEVEQPLAGAVFVVRKQVDGKWRYMVRDEQQTAWVEQMADATHIGSQDDGSFAVKGLAFGDYQLVEVIAPPTTEGQYPLLKEPIPFTIDATSHTLAALMIKNYLIPTLPITGGIGAMVILLLGLSLLGLSGFIYWQQTRR